MASFVLRPCGFAAVSSRRNTGPPRRLLRCHRVTATAPETTQSVSNSSTDETELLPPPSITIGETRLTLQEESCAIVGHPHSCPPVGCLLRLDEQAGGRNLSKAWCLPCVVTHKDTSLTPTRTLAVHSNAICCSVRSEIEGLFMDDGLPQDNMAAVGETIQ